MRSTVESGEAGSSCLSTVKRQPCAPGIGDLGICARALREQADAARREQGMGILQQPRQGCEGARRDDRGRGDLGSLDPRVVDRNGCCGDACGFQEEGRLAAVRLDEGERDPGHDREHEAGQPGAGAEIGRGVRAGRDQRAQAQAVRDVPRPQQVGVAAADKVDGGVPAQEKGGISAQAVHCVTWNALQARIGWGQGVGVPHHSHESTRSTGAVRQPLASGDVGAEPRNAGRDWA